MHIHEEPQPIAPTIAQTRVTPEEFASAVARIEARKDASQRHAEDTISIEDAVRQLGLDATPEEVLAEVQAARAGKSASIPRGKIQEKKQFSLLRPRTLLAIIGGIALAFAWSQWEEVPDAAPATVTMPAPHPIIPRNQPQFLQIDPAHLQVQDNSDARRLMLLSEVGDNQEVYCQLNPVTLTFQDYSTASDRSSIWTLIKHNGKIYVRGYTEKVSPQALQSKGMDVNCDPVYDEVLVTLPLNGFQVQKNPDADASKFHAVNVHLDKYAWEK